MRVETLLNVTPLAFDSFGARSMATYMETLIPEHHFMRDLKYKERIMPVCEAAEDKVRVITAAEYVSREVEMLEAMRKELYAQNHLLEL